MASPTPGYCTFTATARPSWVMARCTWPIDAAAIGVGSHVANTSSGGLAQLLARRPRAASSALIGGALACSSASAWRTGSGRPWSR